MIRGAECGDAQRGDAQRQCPERRQFPASAQHTLPLQCSPGGSSNQHPKFNAIFANKSQIKAGAWSGPVEAKSCHILSTFPPPVPRTFSQGKMLHAKGFS